MPDTSSIRPGHLTSVLNEERVFPPPKSFSARAHIRSMAQYRKLYRESILRPETFWNRQAKAELVWFKPWRKVLQWKLPHAKWFVGGQLNVSYNCLDRHLGTPVANKAALIWEGEPAGPGQVGEERTLTYQQLHREVCLFANVLKRHGIQQGDRIIIYLPMVPEAAIAMLACTRIGAVHSVVFGGFSAQSVADRIFDCQAKLVITADGGYRRGKVVHSTVQGFADIERKAPMQDDTIFRIYSMTKPITSVAFMMLFEEGRVALDEPVHKYIPEWKNLGVFQAGTAPAFLTRPPSRPMLIVDLLRHTSGLTYGFQQRSNVDAAYRESKIGEVVKAGTLSSMIEDLGKIPLEFSPGEAWN